MGKINTISHHFGPGPLKGPIEKQGFPTTGLLVDHVMGKPTRPYSVGMQSEYKSKKKTKSKGTGNHRLS